VGLRQDIGFLESDSATMSGLFGATDPLSHTDIDNYGAQYLGAHRTSQHL
jgi:hypothetical protein